MDALEGHAEQPEHGVDGNEHAARLIDEGDDRLGRRAADADLEDALLGGGGGDGVTLLGTRRRRRREGGHRTERSCNEDAPDAAPGTDPQAHQVELGENVRVSVPSYTPARWAAAGLTVAPM